MQRTDIPKFLDPLKKKPVLFPKSKSNELSPSTELVQYVPPKPTLFKLLSDPLLKPATVNFNCELKAPTLLLVGQLNLSAFNSI